MTPYARIPEDASKADTRCTARVFCSTIASNVTHTFRFAADSILYLERFHLTGPFVVCLLDRQIGSDGLVKAY